MIYILDPGHGDTTPGKRMTLDGANFFEYRSNRQIARLVADRLTELGIEWHWSVDPDQAGDLALTARAAVANSIGKQVGYSNVLFISVHSNACGDGRVWKDSARGWSIYTSPGQTTSDRYATVFYKTAMDLLPGHGISLRKDMSDGDPDYEAAFTVLTKTKCPAVLLEQLFYTSRPDLKFLDSDEGREVLADIIVQSILKIEEM